MISKEQSEEIHNRLAEIRKRFKASISGNWSWRNFGGGWCLMSDIRGKPVVLDDSLMLNVGGILRDFDPEHPDAIAIAESKKDIGDLLDYIEYGQSPKTVFNVPL